MPDARARVIVWPGIMSSTGRQEEIHRHSGWVIPGALFFALMLLSGLILGWYLRPGPRPRAAPTEQSNLVRLNLHGLSFAIAANFIEDGTARAGGEMETVTLITVFPSWRGYSQGAAQEFSGNAPDSQAIRLTLRDDPNGLTARDRLNRIYRPHIANSAAGPFGLTHYAFAPESGYGDDELYAGETKKGLVLFLCEQPSMDFPSPNCSAIDQPLAPGLSYSYRFKRAYLGRWREVATGIDRLIVQFRQR